MEHVIKINKEKKEKCKVTSFPCPFRALLSTKLKVHIFSSIMPQIKILMKSFIFLKSKTKQDFKELFSLFLNILDNLRKRFAQQQSCYIGLCFTEVF